MTLEEARLKLGEALADPRRRQLAHIAILDIAMAVRQALETRGGPGLDVQEATEAISTYLSGEIDSLPTAEVAGGALNDIVNEAIQETSQKPAFAGLFG
ncbi:MAG TPA: hypothetical protein VGR25_09840 [bacterium]|nr:hypothetical protein [bacterium]